MSFDAWIVGFGLSRVLIVLQLLASPAAYGVWLSVAIFDLYLLYLFFWRREGAMFAAQSAEKASG